jgi:hypothetical protein
MAGEWGTGNNQQPIKQQNQLHLLMTTSILLVLLEHAGALLSMEYPAVNLKNLKFEGSTVGISHISDISIRNPSGNPPTFFLDIC